MNAKLKFGIPVLFAMAAAAEMHAETVIAIKSGNWSDPDIWATRV